MRLQNFEAKNDALPLAAAVLGRPPAAVGMASMYRAPTGGLDTMRRGSLDIDTVTRALYLAPTQAPVGPLP